MILVMDSCKEQSSMILYIIVIDDVLYIFIYEHLMIVILRFNV